MSSAMTSGSTCLRADEPDKVVRGGGGKPKGGGGDDVGRAEAPGLEDEKLAGFAPDKALGDGRVMLPFEADAGRRETIRELHEAEAPGLEDEKEPANEANKFASNILSQPTEGEIDNSRSWRARRSAMPIVLVVGRRRCLRGKRRTDIAALAGGREGTGERGQ
jgi:hypothetical protein